MRYTGLMGEFKWWGFAIALVMCIGFALFVFTRFSYVKDANPDEAKAAQNAAAEIQILHAEIKALDSRLAMAECKITASHTGKQSGKQKVGPCSEAGR